MLFLASLLFTLPIGAATVTIVNLDGPNEGFNDPAPAAPVGGNTGTTVGQQRLIVFEHAAAMWGARLVSSVEIRVEAKFDPLSCGPNSGVLGSAGPIYVARDFVGAPLPNTWYSAAHANAIAGIDLNTSQNDVSATFNSEIGTANCLTSLSWYYGLDGNPPSNGIDLLAVVLHEIGHGLGFLSTVSLSTGQKLNGYDDAYMVHLEDHSTGKTYPEMSNTERVSASVNTGNLHWIGSNVTAKSDILSSGRHSSGHVEMYAPNPSQPGSSVSHFSTSLFPNELMEPFISSNMDWQLTVELFKDIGWIVLPPGPKIEPEEALLISESCASENEAIDPGETVTVSLALRNTGAGDTSNLIATLLASGGVASPSEAQSYGVLPALGPAVSRQFSFNASGVCGGTLLATLQLQDGTNDLGTVSFPFTLGFIPRATNSFANAGSIAIPAKGNSGAANPYPSTISVTGITAPITKVTVTLSNLSHSFPADLDILLVGPGGKKVLVMSDTGGGNAINNVVLTFDDGAAQSLPNASQLTSGAYKPTNFGAGDTFPSPAPGAPYSGALSVFNGIDPNGTWALYITDDSNPNSGALNGGWVLTLHTAEPAICCEDGDAESDLLLAMSGPDLVNAGALFEYSITVSNLGPGSAAGVIVTNPLPEGFSIESAGSSQGACTEEAGILTCELGSIPAGSAASIIVQGSAASPGSLMVSAGVNSVTDDPVEANNAASIEIVVNGIPSISSIADQIILEDSSTGAIEFAIDDIETAPEDLVVSGESSNEALMPAASMLFGGSGSSRTLVLTPLPDQFGSSTITLFVSDGLGVSSISFFLTVLPINDPPMLDALAGLLLDEDAGLQTVNLSGISSGAPNEIQALTISAISSDPALIPHPSVTYTSPEATGSITFASTENAFGQATITVTVQDDGGTENGGQDTFSRDFLVTINPVNDPPTISALADQEILEDSSAGPLAFTIGDVEDAAEDLTVWGESSNHALVPVENILLEGSGSDQTVTITPLPDQFGSATITLFVSDGELVSSSSFLLTVLPVNDPPVLDPLADLFLNANAGEQIVALSGISSGADNELQQLSVSATSDNPDLIPDPSVTYTSPDASGSLAFTPSTDAFGLAIIHVIVADDGGLDNGGQNSVTNTFQVTVGAAADLLITKTATPDPVWAGSNLICTITISNLGPHAATGVLVSELLPDGVTFVSAEPSQGSCALDNGILECDLGSMSPGAFATITVIVSPQLEGLLTNTVTMSAWEFDPDESNNAASAVVFVQVDSDGDGLPDHYELAHGLDPNDPTDAALDLDGDGWTHLEEYLAGTDPNNSDSALRITAIEESGDDILISVTTELGRSYRVERNDAFPAGEWEMVQTGIAGTGAIVQATDPGGAIEPQRIYRVVLMPE
jgi:uncharacterized repeat protein (TIGR01451 family)